jgi:hypothetical protein
VSALSDDAAMEFEVVPDDELDGYDEDEAYAFLAGVGLETSTAKLPNSQPGVSVNDAGER